MREMSRRSSRAKLWIGEVRDIPLQSGRSVGDVTVIRVDRLAVLGAVWAGRIAAQRRQVANQMTASLFPTRRRKGGGQDLFGLRLSRSISDRVRFVYQKRGFGIAGNQVMRGDSRAEEDEEA